MDLSDSKEQDVHIDLESGTGVTHSNKEGSLNPSNSNEGSEDNNVNSTGKKMGKKEKCKKVSNAKKPPRPPRGFSLDVYDQKLIKELAQIAMIKRARIERMKALKQKKGLKVSSSTTSSSSSHASLFAMLFTIIFLLVILLQGRNTGVNFQKSELEKQSRCLLSSFSSTLIGSAPPWIQFSPPFFPSGFASFAAGFTGSFTAVSGVCLFYTADNIFYSSVALRWEMAQRMVGAVHDWSTVKTALEVGCGRGILLNAVAMQLKKEGSSGRVVGLDRKNTRYQLSEQPVWKASRSTSPAARETRVGSRSPKITSMWWCPPIFYTLSGSNLVGKQRLPLQKSSPACRGDHNETQAIQRLNLHTAMTNRRHLLWLTERVTELRVVDKIEFQDQFLIGFLVFPMEVL
ncbi:hypothetical protein L1887_00600 [Cichorium endivia]|nr:hypothetical protein L1887_00600 [Cichorium endivia]